MDMTLLGLCVFILSARAVPLVPGVSARLRRAKNNTPALQLVEKSKGWKSGYPADCPAHKLSMGDCENLTGDCEVNCRYSYPNGYDDSALVEKSKGWKSGYPADCPAHKLSMGDCENLTGDCEVNCRYSYPNGYDD